MSNLRIVNTNIADLATLVASTTAGNLVVDNIKTKLKSEIWRSTSTSATITATFASSEFIGCVCFPFCNLTSTATMRVRLYTLAGDLIGNHAYDSGYILCCETGAFGAIGWGTEELGINAFSYGGGTYARVWTTITTAEKVIIDIVDVENLQGYVESGILILGTYWEPEINADYGANSVIDDTSTVSRNEAGDNIVSRGVINRSVSFNLSKMGQTDRNRLMALMRGNGKSSAFFLSLYPENEDAALEQDNQIYGTLSNIQSITNSYYNNFSSGITIEEV